MEFVAKFGEYGASLITPANVQTKIEAVNEASEQQNIGKNQSISATADTKATIKRLKEPPNVSASRRCPSTSRKI